MSASGEPVFNCLRCSHCCFFARQQDCPVLLPHEVYYLKALAEHMGLSELQFRELSNGMYQWIISGYCPFYDREKSSCRVNTEKPLSCNMFPLLINTATNELLVSSECSWIKRNINNLAELGEKAEEVFPHEIAAVKDLLTIIYGAIEDELKFVIFRSNQSLNEFNKLSGKCSILKLQESGNVKGLYLVLVTGCSEGDILEAVQGFGQDAKLLFLGEMRTIANYNNNSIDIKVLCKAARY